MNEITKEDFEDYEEVRSSGKTNMFAVDTVVNLSQQLTKEKCFEIMKNYDKYMEQWPEVRGKY